MFVIVGLYSKADSLPSFKKLQEYRDDGTVLESLYSNPDYFFELLKTQYEEAKKERREARRKRKKNKKENPQRVIKEPIIIKTRAEKLREKLEHEGILDPRKRITLELSNLPRPDFSKSFDAEGDIIKSEKADPSKFIRDSFASSFDITDLPPSIPENPENTVNEAYDQAESQIPVAPPPPNPMEPVTPPPPPPPMPIPDKNVDVSTVGGTGTSLSSQLVGVKLRKHVQEEEPIKEQNEMLCQRKK